MAETSTAVSQSGAASRDGVVKVKVIKRRRRHRSSGNQRRHYVHMAKMAVFWFFALTMSGAIAYGCVAKMNTRRPAVIHYD
jgi:hypothetical protein